MSRSSATDRWLPDLVTANGVVFYLNALWPEHPARHHVMMAVLVIVLAALVTRRAGLWSLPPSVLAALRRPVTPLSLLALLSVLLAPLWLPWSPSCVFMPR